VQSELIGKVLRIGCALPSGTRFLQIIPIKMKRAISVRKAALVVATVRNTSLAERRFMSASRLLKAPGVSIRPQSNQLLPTEDRSEATKPS
jgi:hypothetical protein